jgi:hypothetical protein
MGGVRLLRRFFLFKLRPRSRKLGVALSDFKDGRDRRYWMLDVLLGPLRAAIFNSGPLIERHRCYVDGAKMATRAF